MDFFYSDLSKSWQSNKYFKNMHEEWKFTVGWVPAHDMGGFKFNLSVDRKLNEQSLRSKLLISVKLSDFSDKDRNFALDFVFKPKTSVLVSSKDAFLQFKMITDDIGLFKNDLKIKMKG